MTFGFLNEPRGGGGVAVCFSWRTSSQNFDTFCKNIWLKMAFVIAFFPNARYCIGFWWNQHLFLNIDVILPIIGYSKAQANHKSWSFLCVKVGNLCARELALIWLRSHPGGLKRTLEMDPNLGHFWGRFWPSLNPCQPSQIFRVQTGLFTCPNHHL